ALLREVLQQDPNDHESRHQFAQALRQAGNTDEADTEANRVSEIVAQKAQLAKLNTEAILHPTDATVRDQIAELCLALGKPELAATWRKAAAACRQGPATPRPSAK